MDQGVLTITSKWVFPQFLHTALLCIDFILSGSILAEVKWSSSSFMLIFLAVSSTGKRECLYYSSPNRSLVTASLDIIGSQSLFWTSVSSTMGFCDGSGLIHIPLHEAKTKFKGRLLYYANLGDWNGWREYFPGGRVFPTRSRENGCCVAIKQTNTTIL